MNTALIITGILVAAFIALFIAARAKLRNIPVVADHEKIITLTDKNFQHQTKNRVMLVDFWANWCAPCRMMAPVLNDVAADLKGNLHIGKVNIEDYQALAQKYQIRSIPTMILFKNGREYERFTGIKSKEFLINHINNAS
jgi:thioredoxin 1